MKFSINQFPEDLVAFTEEILKGKFHFLCNVREHADVRACNKMHVDIC